MKTKYIFFVISIFYSLVYTNLHAQKFTEWKKIYSYNGGGVFIRYQLLSCKEGGVSGIMYNPLVEIHQTTGHTFSWVFVYLKGKQCSGEITNSSFSESGLESGEYESDPGNWNTWRSIIGVRKLEFRYEIGEDNYKVVCDFEGDRLEHLTINGKTRAQIAAEKKEKEEREIAEAKRQAEKKAEEEKIIAEKKAEEVKKQAEIKAAELKKAEEVKAAKEEADRIAAEKREKEAEERRLAKIEAERLEAERKEREKQENIKQQMQALDSKRQASDENNSNNLIQIEQTGQQLKNSYDIISKKSHELKEITGGSSNKSSVLDDVPEDDDFVSDDTQQANNNSSSNEDCCCQYEGLAWNPEKREYLEKTLVCQVKIRVCLNSLKNGRIVGGIPGKDCGVCVIAR